jgi:transcriptional regulator with XRE-family HTH domain
MNTERLRECLSAIRWSQHDLARALDCSPRLIRRWASGDAAVPDVVARWLATLASTHVNHPPPTDWRSNMGYAGK